MIRMIGESLDDRAFDGAYSAAFLSRLKQVLEEQSWGDELGRNSSNVGSLKLIQTHWEER
jgi:hypothetical protein